MCFLCSSRCVLCRYVVCDLWVYRMYAVCVCILYVCSVCMRACVHACMRACVCACACACVCACVCVCVCMCVCTYVLSRTAPQTRDTLILHLHAHNTSTYYLQYKYILPTPRVHTTPQARGRLVLHFGTNSQGPALHKPHERVEDDDNLHGIEYV